MTTLMEELHPFEADGPEYSPWIEAKDLDWGNFVEELRVKEYKKGSVIYHQEEMTPFVYLIKSGRIRLDVYSETGGKKSLFVAGPGSMFGEMTPLDDMPCVCNATAAVDSEIYLIPNRQFVELVENDQLFCRNLMRLMTRKTRLMASSIKQLVFNNSTSRVAYALVNLMKQYSVDMKDGRKRLTMKFTQQEMADLTGLSRVSVSNIFMELTAKNVISKEKGYLIIEDVRALYEACISETP